MLTSADLIVSVNELIEYMSLDIGLSGSQLVAAEQVIAGVQEGLEEHLGRPITVRQFTETIQVDEHTAFLKTSKSPVVSVISKEPTSTVPELQYGGISAYDDIFGLPTDILGLSGWYVVTYTAGEDGKNNQAMRLKVMEVASRFVVFHHDDTRSIANDTARPTAPTQQKYWTEEELAQFDRHRRRTVV